MGRQNQYYFQRIAKIVAAFASVNACLLDWCEHEGWEINDSGGGCSALIRQDGALVRRITRDGEAPCNHQTGNRPLEKGSPDGSVPT